MDEKERGRIGLEMMAQAEAIRRLAVGMKQFYRIAGQPGLWDLVVNASWPESPRWFDVKLDPSGDRAVEMWKARVAELLGESERPPPATE